ncbi:MAG: SIMPL domain-containing protein [Planctomycetaceae bacterium]|nr:SIMPL domain-containing protein [Planctomycetales bacterium]MCB9925415.1 SIMPL domain-containing protein [Planctomycetaceae bacterium]
MKSVLIILATLAGTTASIAEERSITVTAKSEIKVDPDEVVMHIAVRTRDEHLLPAKKANDKIASAVLALASTHKIPKEDMQVTDLDVLPDYGEYGRRNPTPLVYDFVRSIQVRLTDFQKIEPFLSDAYDAGLSHVASLQFRVTNQREHQFEARRLAVMYAKEKAQHLAELTGMTLGSPLRIEEDVENNWRAGGFGGGGGGFGGGLGAVNRSTQDDKTASKTMGIRFVAFQEQADESGTESLIAPGQIVITAHVTIEYTMHE